MKILVGVSEVPGKHPALDWAGDFAHDRETVLELVHVVDDSLGRLPDGYSELAILAAEERLRDIARAAELQFPELTVVSHVRIGSPVNELVAAADDADLLVIGAHPERRYDGAGRRAVRIARLAPCSVVVAPSEVIPAGTGVVVGIDGAADSRAAVDFAAELANRHGEKLVILLAWMRPEAWGLADPFLIDQEPSEEDSSIVAEVVREVGARYPGLVIDHEVCASRPERALYAASLDARMLVVGSRGRSGLRRALLGSVSEAVVAELPCPVAVIRDSRRTS